MKPTQHETRSQDILEANDVEAIVNPVNCVGSMGKGLALQFAKRYPSIIAPYRQACRDSVLTIHNPQILIVNQWGLPKYVVNLATKIHWRNQSQMAWIESGLTKLYSELRDRGVTSVGIPPLGAGLGGLKWEDVLATINNHADRNDDIKTVIFTPR